MHTSFKFSEKTVLQNKHQTQLFNDMCTKKPEYYVVALAAKLIIFSCIKTQSRRFRRIVSCLSITAVCLNKKHYIPHNADPHCVRPKLKTFFVTTHN